MAKTATKLEWCIVRLGSDMNWWVDKISDTVNWDTSDLSIVDPRQIAHILDLMDPLREYGLEPDLFDAAFFTFRIDKEMPGNKVRLVRVNESLFDTEEKLFALPDILDEEKGPYADFIDHITKLRVKMLNDLIDFEQHLTIEELEEEIRELQQRDYIEGKVTHAFNEVTAILEYVPMGFELDEEESFKSRVAADEEEYADIGEDIEEEDIEEDETMRWDEEEEGAEEDEEEEDLEDDEDDEDEEDDDDDR